MAKLTDHRIFVQGRCVRGVALSVAQGRKRWPLLCCFVWTRPVWTLSVPVCLDTAGLFQGAIVVVVVVVCYVVVVVVVVVGVVVVQGM